MHLERASAAFGLTGAVLECTGAELRLHRGCPPTQCFLKECIRRAEYALLHKSGHSVYSLRNRKQINKRVYTAESVYGEKRMYTATIRMCPAKIRMHTAPNTLFFLLGPNEVFWGQVCYSHGAFCVEKAVVSRKIIVFLNHFGSKRARIFIEFQQKTTLEPYF